MKKTVPISVASIPFTIEEDAYQMLEQYLSSIKGHFAGSPESAEIVSDIESRIAEQFTESAKAVVPLEEVRKVIASMGNAEDFDRESSASAAPAEHTQRRLYRNPEDKVVAGVASGLAAYLGIDVVWVRVAFALLTAANGFGVLLYAILWMSTSEAKGPVQRLEMAGTPVTLEALSEQVKERVDEVKRDHGTLRRAVALPFSVAGRVLSFIATAIFPAIGKLIGALVSLSSALALLALSVGAGLIVTHLGGEYVDFPVTEVLSRTTIVSATALGYVALAVPLIFLAFLGTMLVSRTVRLRGAIVASLGTVWFVALAASIVVGVSVCTKVAAFISNDPAYQQTQRTASVSNISELRVADGLSVTYVQGPNPSLTIIGRTKDLDHLSATAVDGLLSLEPTQRTGFCVFCDYGIPRVTVTAPNIQSFTGEHGARIEAKRISSPATVTVELSDGSRGTFEVTAPNIEATVENGSRLNLSGATSDATLTAEDGSTVDAFGLTTSRMVARVLHGSKATVGTTGELDAQASDGSAIRYLGSPKLVQSTDGDATIEPIEQLERRY